MMMMMMVKSSSVTPRTMTVIVLIMTMESQSFEAELLAAGKAEVLRTMILVVESVHQGIFC